MSDPSHGLDHQIINTAYADRVRDAFRVFAEAISMGENEKACRERFLRSLQITRRARDLALDAMNGINMVEPTPELLDPSKRREQPVDPLSAEDQAMIDMALSKTTGVSTKPVVNTRPIQRR
jgi:hypothetical protein